MKQLLADNERDRQRYARQYWMEKLRPLKNAGFECVRKGKMDSFNFVYRNCLFASFDPYYTGLVLRTIYLPMEFRGKGVFREFCTDLSSFPRDTQLMAVVRPFELYDESKAEDFSFDGMRFRDDPEAASQISKCLKKHAGFETKDPMNVLSIREISEKIEKGLPLSKGELLVRPTS